MMLSGKITQLRALEPSDVDLLYRIENDTEMWSHSDNLIPFSKESLSNYIKHAHTDIYEAKQYRFVIQNSENMPVGLVDIYDFNPKHRRAGVGIIVLENERKKGYAKDALQTLSKYTREVLNLHQLYAEVAENNTQCIKLFLSCGYLQTGQKKDWVCLKGKFNDTLIFQLLMD